jgi:sugar-specific transcriptional regulator TrmB
MIQQIKQFLTDLNLSDKEATLYISALQLGPQTASTFSRKTGICRSTVNFIFDELIKKGFASKETHESTTRFSVIPPETIEYMLQEKVTQYKKQMTDFRDLLPFLNSMQNKLSPLPRVRYFEGVSGLCRMLDDFCAIDQTVLYISGHNMMHPKIREYTYDVYIPISNKHKNKNKIILNEGKKSREYEKIAAEAYGEFIFVDPKLYPFTLTTAIYGSKTAFWSYDPSDMSGVIIENELIAKNMRTFFEILKRFLGNKK